MEGIDIIQPFDFHLSSNNQYLRYCLKPVLKGEVALERCRKNNKRE